MVFSSLFFIFGFLPLFLSAYYLCPTRFRNLVAVGASVIFYAWGAPRFICVLLFGAAVDYRLSLGIARGSIRRARKKALLSGSLVMNLGILFFFKYANFFVGEVSGILEAAGFGGIAWIHIALPIGISFFTFQKISYMVDVYRGTTLPARDMPTCLLYVVLFPQLIAGPIIRYHDIAEQLTGRTHSMERFLSGVRRFCFGLGKKVLIANTLGRTADVVFGLNIAQLPESYAWVGLFAYSFQIYFDFSGYSDMAIGLGKMMGFEFLENFNSPYISRSFTEFWRRWHISLSNFMREYLYIPLGGNRDSRFRTFTNLWIVFLLSGLWHGAAWPFVVWGAFNGLFITLDKVFWLRLSARLPRFITIPLTYFLVTVGWAFFRSPDIGYAIRFIMRMGGLTQNTQLCPIPWADVLSHRGLTMFFAAAALSFLPAWSRFGQCVDSFRRTAAGRGSAIVGCSASVVVLFLSACSLANLDFNPFIYFRF